MNVKLKLMVSSAPEKFITFIKFIKFINFMSLLHGRQTWPSGHIRCQLPPRFVAPLWSLREVAMADLPRGTVTFLLADIEGSTAL